MQSYEFETMCRWVAARVRRRGMNVGERDPFFMDAVSALELKSVSEAVGLGEAGISSVAEQLGDDKEKAA